MGNQKEIVVHINDSRQRELSLCAFCAPCACYSAERGKLIAHETVISCWNYEKLTILRASHTVGKNSNLEFLGRPQGFPDLEKIAERAAGICAVEIGDIFSRGKQPDKVKARSLFCYWASSELGIKHLELARRIGISGPGVGSCVERGKQIAAEDGYRLLERIET